MNTKTFEQIRDEYEQAREQERKELAEYLKDEFNKNNDYKELYVVIGTRAGKGKNNYTNNGTIAKFNLENWKWVEVKTNHNSFNCIISLNMIDIDKKTGNFHALYDRIGIIISSDKTPHTKHICTNIDLPLNDGKKQHIFEMVVREYNLYRV